MAGNGAGYVLAILIDFYDSVYHEAVIFFCPCPCHTHRNRTLKGTVAVGMAWAWDYCPTKFINKYLNIYYKFIISKFKFDTDIKIKRLGFMRKITFILLMIFLLNIQIYSDGYSDIDWIDGRVYSSYSIYNKNDYNFAANRLAGINIAREKAKINFYKVLKRINIYESLSLLDYFKERGGKNRELFSLIDSAELYQIEYPDVNSIKLTYYIDIFGDNSLMSIMISERDIFTEDLKGYMGFHYDTKYTGVIIDARRELISYDGFVVKVKPSIFIVIKDDEGRLVFDQNNVYPEIIREKGMVRYSYDIYEDQTKRVGNNPFRIVASGTGDRSGSNIVITVSDAKRMLSSETTRKAIQNGKVVILIEP